MKEEDKDLEYWRKNAEEDYMTVPISVLRYITELEKATKQMNSSNDIQNVSDLLISFVKEFQANNKWQSLTPEEMAEIYLDE